MRAEYLLPGPCALCRLTIRVDGSWLMLDDPGEGCHSARGVRASFNESVFSRGARRPIRYLPGLMRSPEFRQALAEAPTYPADTLR